MMLPMHSGLLFHYFIWTLPKTIGALSASLPKDVLRSPVVITSAVTIPGSDPDRPQKVNQDASFSNGRHFIGVMDGHGLNGHLITHFLQSRFPQRLAQYCSTRPPNHGEAPLLSPDVPILDDDTEFQVLFTRQSKDIKELGKFHEEDDIVVNNLKEDNDRRLANGLTNAFLAVHLDARRDSTIPTGRSGSTAIVALLDTAASTPSSSSTTSSTTTNLYVAGVGDSSAILVDSTGSVQNLLPKTTLKLDSERRRIESCKGSIVGGNVFYGPVGIAMTRALGDTVMLPAGVVPVPMVRATALNTNECYCVCLGSDGVFDVLSQDTVAAMIHSTTPDDDYAKRLYELAQSICSEARYAWQADLPVETSVDDITCALMIVGWRR
jgi:serine/threonine protein phosphatase PrpC